MHRGVTCRSTRAGLLLTCAAAVLQLQLCAAYRLPTHVVPRLYTLHVDTRLGDDAVGDFGFDGRVSVKVQVRNSTDVIFLHSKGLEIADNEIVVTESSEANDTDENVYSSASYVPEDDFLVIKLSRPATEGRLYDIGIKFRGNLSEGLSGYYRSSYRDHAGNKRWLAVTHFEPSDARKAFPCFDEPEMKAQFQINLGRRENYRSASNMPLKTTEPMAGRPGWYLDRYESSPKMSTYLAAFMVADLVSVESSSREGDAVTLRVWARPQTINQTDYALRVGRTVLKHYEEYFNLSYPLPKVDMAAIPDFGPGAMENWGLITYREAALLYDPSATSAERKARVAYVIAHELAHQWFGNLVTMRWWSDLWLNEGFATYVGSLGVHHAHPDWHYLESEAMEHSLITMSLDALKSSHPISVAVARPEEVSQIFDAISYKKGAALLRMINHFLGEDVFRRGVSSYLHEHQYGNAVQDDLWSSLTAEAHRQRALAEDMTVKKIMDTWTLQTGYPVVTVTRDYEQGTATLAQTRYLLDKTQANATGTECWIIPITYSSASEPKFEDTSTKLWMTCEREVTTISDLPGPEQWIILNNKVSGLYRVQYDERNWRLIGAALNSSRFGEIDALNRAQLLNDLMNFAWTGDVSYDVALGAASYLRQERSYMPWRTALGAFNRLDKILRRTPDYHLYRSFLKSVLRESVERMVDIADLPAGHLDLKHHVQLVMWSCRLQIGTCTRQASELFRRWTDVADPDSENPIPRDLRSIVYCTALKYGSETEWNFLWERYLNSNVPTEKATLLNSLGCTREAWILRRCLHMAHTAGSPIRKQDSGFMFYAVSSNDVGYPLAKEYFLNNFGDVYNYFRPKAVKLSGYIKTLAHHMFTQKELDEWQQFLDSNVHLLKESERAVQQSLESVRVNVLWHRDHYHHLARFLQARSSAT